MIVAVSPYHLTTREIPATVSLLLATQAVTVMPGVDAAGERKAQQAGRHVPGYVRFIETWAWTLPLWRSGAIASSYEGIDAGPDVRRCCELIEHDERLAALRPFMKPGLTSDTDEYLHAVARDVIKGGPDPAISVPLAGGLDRFATRIGAIVARPEAASVAQRAEAAMAAPVAAVVVPALVRASGERIAEVREHLHEQLEALRAAITAAVDGGAEAAVLKRNLSTAAGDYTRAFEAAQHELVDPLDEDCRCVAGPVALTIVKLPEDAALSSSALAARSVLGGKPAAGGKNALAVRSDPSAGPVAAMYIRAVGVPSPTMTHSRRR